MKNLHDRIEIVCVKGMAPNTPGIEYIGREYGGWKESPLQNETRLQPRQQRGATLDKYHHDLWRKIKARDTDVMAELNRLADMVLAGQNIKLGCWCSQPGPCHGSIVKAAIVWWAGSR